MKPLQTDLLLVMTLCFAECDGFKSEVLNCSPGSRALVPSAGRRPPGAVTGPDLNTFQSQNFEEIFIFPQHNGHDGLAHHRRRCILAAS